MTALSADAPARTGSGQERAIGIWLLACAAMIFAMAVIGAITDRKSVV